MCYSAMLQQDAKSLGKKYDARLQLELEGQDRISIRVFPHQSFPVVFSQGEERKIQLMNYSLVPSWAKERKPKFATYNARIETICEKATWKTPVTRQRCLVPITSFYESCHEGTHAGNIVAFSPLNDGGVLTAAGIWDEWTDKESGEVLQSFAIITTQPSAFIERTGHDRSPVFLPMDAAEAWLNPKTVKCHEASQFLLERATEPALKVEIERPLKKAP